MHAARTGVVGLRRRRYYTHACLNLLQVWSAYYLDATYDDSTLQSTPPLPEGNPDVDAAGTGGNGGTYSCNLSIYIIRCPRETPTSSPPAPGATEVRTPTCNKFHT